MFCDFCHKNEANILYRQSINGAESEYHLCQDCLSKIRSGQDRDPQQISNYFADLFDDMPFGSMRRLKHLTSAFDDDIFQGLVNGLSGGALQLDLSPFFHSAMAPFALGPISLEKASPEGEATEDAVLKKSEATHDAEDQALCERLARLSFDENGKLKLELENKEDRSAAQADSGNAEKVASTKLPLTRLTIDKIQELLTTLSPSMKRALLEEQKRLAVEAEAYEDAAALRDLMSGIDD
ncbi:MAG: UvrB/UvrC motif-containing protein [Eubacteriales bacterium]|nr:UvrB/UvrC motif-containing protein [Eubacteriales bacterium]